MRVTQQSIGSELVYQINRNFERMNLYRLQVSTGKRINSFADDPRALGTVNRINALVAQNAQHQRNMSSARTFLEAADTSLQGLSGIITDLRQLVIQETGPLANDQSRDAAINDVRGLRDSALALMNQQVAGSYIFGGYQTGREPFSLVSGEVTYNGDANQQEVQIGPSLRIPVTVPGSEFLGSDSASLAGGGNLRPRVEGGTALSELNGGEGVSLGRISIAAGADPPIVVDLSGAATVQDVIDTINASGVSVTASIGPDEEGLQLVGPEPIAVSEVLGGSTAGDLGLLGSTTGNTLRGTNVQPALDTTVSLSQIRSLDGELPLGTLRFDIGGTVTDVDLSSAATFDDIRNAVQSAIPDMDVQVTDGVFVFRYDQPQGFTVESPSGDPTADLLGVNGEASPARLFEVFGDVLSALESGDRDALRNSLVELEAVQRKVNAENVAIGARQKSLDQNEALLMQRAESLQLERSRLEDVDIVDAATRLSSAEQAYSAALASSASIFNLSLLNYL